MRKLYFTTTLCYRNTYNQEFVFIHPTISIGVEHIECNFKARLRFYNLAIFIYNSQQRSV